MNISTYDIKVKLEKENISISDRTIERILKGAGFEKLKRRTNRELGKSSKNKKIPEGREGTFISK